jgi:hypothetical protein
VLKGKATILEKGREFNIDVNPTAQTYAHHLFLFFGDNFIKHQ